MKVTEYARNHKRVVTLVIIVCALLLAGGTAFYIKYHHDHPPRHKVDGTFEDTLSAEDKALYKATHVVDLNGKTDASKKTGALAAYDKAIKDAATTNDKFIAYSQKAGFCYQQKDWQCAGDSYAAAYKLNTKAWDVAWTAAQAYENVTNPTKALEYYKLASNGASDQDNGNGSPKTQIAAKITELSK